MSTSKQPEVYKKLPGAIASTVPRRTSFRESWVRTNYTGYSVASHSEETKNGDKENNTEELVHNEQSEENKGMESNKDSEDEVPSYVKKMKSYFEQVPNQSDCYESRAPKFVAPPSDSDFEVIKYTVRVPFWKEDYEESKTRRQRHTVSHFPKWDYICEEASSTKEVCKIHKESVPIKNEKRLSRIESIKGQLRSNQKTAYAIPTKILNTLRKTGVKSMEISEPVLTAPANLYVQPLSDSEMAQITLENSDSSNDDINSDLRSNQCTANLIPSEIFRTPRKTAVESMEISEPVLTAPANLYVQPLSGSEMALITSNNSGLSKDYVGIESSNKSLSPYRKDTLQSLTEIAHTALVTNKRSVEAPPPRTRREGGHNLPTDSTWSDANRIAGVVSGDVDGETSERYYTDRDVNSEDSDVSSENNTVINANLSASSCSLTGMMVPDDISGNQVNIKDTVDLSLKNVNQSGGSHESLDDSSKATPRVVGASLKSYLDIPEELFDSLPESSVDPVPVDSPNEKDWVIMQEARRALFENSVLNNSWPAKEGEQLSDGRASSLSTESENNSEYK